MPPTRKSQQQAGPTPNEAAAKKRQLPAWYHRLVVLGIKQNREVQPEDFDEDLSDLASSHSGGKRRSAGVDSCYCEGSECGCESVASDGSGTCSDDQSYDGSDADYYHELKELREERKQELLDLKEQDEKEKQVAREIELEMEDKVREVRERLEKQMATGKGDEPPGIGNAGQYLHFKLFSVEHVDYFYNDFYASKYVEFYSQAAFDGDQEYDEEAKPGENDELGGHVYFNSSAGCDLTSFLLPKKASLEEFRVPISDREYDGHHVAFQFLGDGYLTMTIDRHIVFGQDTPTDSAPEKFMFVGIRQDILDQDQSCRKRKRAVSSPRETWFERTHPMGSYNLG